MLLTFIILLFCSVQGNACVVQSVAPSVRALVSHCPLHVDYYLTEFAILATYYSSLENVCIEACDRCFFSTTQIL